MIRKLTVTLTMEDEINPEDYSDIEDYNSEIKQNFDEVSDSWWDQVGRPLDRMMDEGWKITKKKCEYKENKK